MSREDKLSRIRDKFGENYEVLSDNIDDVPAREARITILHKKCGRAYDRSVAHVLSSDASCKYCSSNRTYTREEVASLLGDDYTLEGEFKGYSKVNKVRHNKCGTVLDIRPNVIVRGESRCLCDYSQSLSTPIIPFLKEEWREVPGYPNYVVSNTGSVKNKVEHTIKPHLNNKGYPHVFLSHDGVRKNIPVHRVVALAFISNPDNLPFIHHVDENPLNPRVDNLQWCTQKYNMNQGTLSKKRKVPHSKGREVYALFEDGTDMYFSSLTKAEEYFGAPITVAHIGHVLDGVQKTTGGLVFEEA